MSTCIPQRNVDLVYGFIKHIDIPSQIPIEIIDICILYTNINKDSFDTTIDKDQLEIIDNQIFGNKNNATHQIVFHRKNMYLNNIAINGIHIWKFQFLQQIVACIGGAGSALYNVLNGSSVGIFKTKYKTIHTGAFDKLTEDGRIPLGYAVGFTGLITKPNAFSNRSKKFDFEMKNGDMMAMILNMNKLTLSIEVNDKDYGKAFDVEDTEYRAVVTVGNNHDKWKLISYQHIY